MGSVLRVPNAMQPVVVMVGSGPAIASGRLGSLGHVPQLAGGASGVIVFAGFGPHHPLADEGSGSAPEPRPDADDLTSSAPLGRRVVPRARRWWNQSSYLTDVASAFTVVTVVNSVMMVSGWDTPKTGAFAYIHLLSRLAIVAAVVALFHLDGIRNAVAGWRDTNGSGWRARATVALRGQLPGDPVGRWTLSFSSVTVLACVAALASSPWREPAAGPALYWALLVLAATSAVLVGGATWRSRRAPEVGGGEAA